MQSSLPMHGSGAEEPGSLSTLPGAPDEERDVDLQGAGEPSSGIATDHGEPAAAVSLALPVASDSQWLPLRRRHLIPPQDQGTEQIPANRLSQLVSSQIQGSQDPGLSTQRAPETGVQAAKKAARTYQRLKPHMLRKKQRTFAIPANVWLSDGPSPRLPFIPIEDPIEGLSYMMCSYCNCDKIFRQADRLVRHMEDAQDCPKGAEQLLTLRPSPDLLILGSGAVTQSESRHGALSPKPEAARWRRAAELLGEAFGAPVPPLPPAAPAEKAPTTFSMAMRRKLMQELRRLCPRKYTELSLSIQGLLNRSLDELASLVLEAQQNPEPEITRPAESRCGSPGNFAAVQRAFGAQLGGKISESACSAGSKSSAMLISEVADFAPFAFSKCTSEFLHSDLRWEEEAKARAMRGRQTAAGPRKRRSAGAQVPGPEVPEVVFLD